MNKKVLLSFIGGTDIKNAENYETDPSAIIQICKYLKPDFIYLFISSEFIESYSKSKLRQILKTILPNMKLEEIFCEELTNPTDSELIYKTIEQHINKINTFIKLNKHQGYINLTSGTPQLISVLSLMIITGIIERTTGIYAPNPKYGNSARLDKLDFFKSAVGYETIKNLLQKYDFYGVLSIINGDKYFKEKFSSDSDFFEILNFIQNRFISDYDKALEIYSNSECLKTKFPTFLINTKFDLCVERFYTLKPLKEKNESAQAIIWAAITRENLITYLTDKLLPNGFTSIAIKDPDKGTYKLHDYLMAISEPELQNYMNDEWNKQLRGGRLDLNRELNQSVIQLIMNYAGEKYAVNKEIWSKTKKLIITLEKVAKTRNEIAHGIVCRKFEPKWIELIKDLLNCTSILLKEDANLDSNPYDKAQNILLEKLEVIYK